MAALLAESAALGQRPIVAHSDKFSVIGQQFCAAQKLPFFKQQV